MITTLQNPAKWLVDLFGGSKGKVRVDAETTLHSAPFWYGVNKISGNVGTLPLNVMKDLSPGAEKAKKHPAYYLLRKRPNTYQTPLTFKQTLTQQAILWGNGRAYIHRVGNKPTELIPLRPDCTLTGMVDGEKWHATRLDSDDRTRSVVELVESMKDNPDAVVMIPDRDVLHIQGFGDGISGLSLFQVAKNSLEISLGSDQRASKQMTRGFAGKVMLEAPESSPMFRDQKQAEEFLKDFKEKHGADGDADAIGLLRGGVKANVLQMSNKDAEFIEQRMFQRQEAALWLMLESILGDDSSVSYNSLEQKMLGYLVNCLSTWLVRWEEECAYKLLTEKEFLSGSHFVRFNVASLLRTDFPTTIETLAKGIAAKIINPNEAREKIDMNPYEGGEAYENPSITPGDGTVKKGKKDETSKTKKEARALSAAETVQKVYLGVGKVVTSDEARKIINDGAGTDLAIPGPEFVTEPNQSQSFSAVQSRLEHLLGVEQKRVAEYLNRGDDHEKIAIWYEGWETTLSKAVEDMGFETQAVKNHCKNNLKYLARKPKTFDLTGSAELLAREICNV